MSAVVIPAYNSSVPMSAASDSAALLASTTLSGNTWVRSNIIDVRDAREIVLLVTYTAEGSGGAGGYPWIVPMGAATAEEPAAGDATWFPFTVNDGIVTATTAVGTFPSGADFGAGYVYGVMTFWQLALRTPAALSDSAPYYGAIPLNVSRWSWFQLQVQERGDSANPGTISISYLLGSG